MAVMRRTREPAPAAQEQSPRPAEPVTAGYPGGWDWSRYIRLDPAPQVGATTAPEESEADRAAEAMLEGRPAAIGSSGADVVRRRACAACAGSGCSACANADEIRRSTDATDDGGTVSPEVAADLRELGSGRALPAEIRDRFQPLLGIPLDDVRVHDDARAARLATELDAEAFALGDDIVLGAPLSGTQDDARLIAHELAHVAQQHPRTIRRQDSEEPDHDLGDVVDEMVAAVRRGEVARVTAALRGRGIVELGFIRGLVQRQANVRLERWFATRIRTRQLLEALPRPWLVVLRALESSELQLGTLRVPVVGSTSDAAAAEEGIRWIWPVVPLLDRLELYVHEFSEIEDAQLDIIRGSSEAERRAARREHSRLNAIYSRMSAGEEYEARKLIDPDDLYGAVLRLVVRARGVLVRERDIVFDAVLELPPPRRRALWQFHHGALLALVERPRYELLRVLMQGTEAEAVMARLRLATEGRLDDLGAVSSVVDRAQQLLAEQRVVRAQLASESLSGEDRGTLELRLRELGELESLLEVTHDETGAIARTTFLGGLAAAAPGEAFGEWARSLGADPVAVAREQIRAAVGTSVDAEAIARALLAIHVPVAPIEGETAVALEERQRLANNAARADALDDDFVRDALTRLARQGPSGAIEVDMVRRLARADRFDELLHAFDVARRAGRWADVYLRALDIAQRDDWRARFWARASEPWSAYGSLRAPAKPIVDAILETQRIPVERLLESTGDMETLRPALRAMDEETRETLRLGYWLDRERQDPTDESSREALRSFRSFEQAARRSQAWGRSDIGVELGTVDPEGAQDLLDAALGSDPTLEELATPEGRYRAAGLWHHRHEERLALRRGLAVAFTEADESMDAAARVFGALWVRAREQGELSMLDFAALGVLHERFEGRARELADANAAVGEIAGMVAATVAAMVVVVATGGSVTVPVIAAAIAAGASGRVLTREMFGGDYYDASSAEAARDLALGGIDGALAVVGSSLASRATQLMGLSGRALTQGAARAGAHATNQASRSLGRRIAAETVESAIDGALSGFVSEAVGSMTSSQTWQNGIWSGILRVGQAALLGGLTGLGGGALGGLGMAVVGAAGRRLYAALVRDGVEAAARRAGSGDTFDALVRAWSAGDLVEARRLARELEPYLGPRHAQVLLTAVGGSDPGTLLLSKTLQLSDGAYALSLMQFGQHTELVLAGEPARHVLERMVARAADASHADASRWADLLRRVTRLEDDLAAGRVLAHDARREFDAIATDLRGAASEPSTTGYSLRQAVDDGDVTVRRPLDGDGALPRAQDEAAGVRGGPPDLHGELVARDLHDARRIHVGGSPHTLGVIGDEVVFCTRCGSLRYRLELIRRILPSSPSQRLLRDVEAAVIRADRALARSGAPRSLDDHVAEFLERGLGHAAREDPEVLHLLSLSLEDLNRYGEELVATASGGDRAAVEAARRERARAIYRSLGERERGYLPGAVDVADPEEWFVRRYEQGYVLENGRWRRLDRPTPEPEPPLARAPKENGRLETPDELARRVFEDLEEGSLGPFMEALADPRIALIQGPNDVRRAFVAANRRARAGQPGILIERRTLSEVRQDLKNLYRQRLVERIDAQPTAAQSFELMLELTQTMNNADRGAIAEMWYRRRVLGSAWNEADVLEQVPVRVGDRGRRFDFIDLRGGRVTSHEVKFGRGPISSHDEQQFLDFMEAIEDSLSASGPSGGLVVERHVMAFLHPEGAAANWDWIVRRARDYEQVTFRLRAADGTVHELDRSVARAFPTPFPSFAAWVAR